jgi:hypothetical protein
MSTSFITPGHVRAFQAVTTQLYGEVIRGAEAIAEFIFGDRSHRRKVYHLAECSQIPIHRLGRTLCLRPSAYKLWIEDQEHRAMMDAKREA